MTSVPPTPQITFVTVVGVGRSQRADVGAKRPERAERRGAVDDADVGRRARVWRRAPRPETAGRRGRARRARRRPPRASSRRGVGDRPDRDQGGIGASGLPTTSIGPVFGRPKCAVNSAATESIERPRARPSPRRRAAGTPRSALGCGSAENACGTLRVEQPLGRRLERRDELVHLLLARAPRPPPRCERAGSPPRTPSPAAALSRRSGTRRGRCRAPPAPTSSRAGSTPCRAGPCCRRGRARGSTARRSSG